jgi:outer membrane immunogenic protein
MKRLILGVAAALMLSAGPAAADGMRTKGSIKSAPAAAGPNWNGFYVGAGFGVGAVVHDVSVSERNYEPYGDESYRSVFGFDGIGGEGAFGTVSLGYDRVIRPGWVGGVFVDYDFSGISTDSDIGSIDHDSSWALGARLGVLANPSTLLYATGGYTQAEFDISGLGSQTYDGYFVGAGVETFLHQNWTLKLEYRFSQFGDETILDDGIKVDLEPSIHTARVVLSYKFGHPHH